MSGPMHLSRFGQLPFRLDDEAQRQVAAHTRSARPKRTGAILRISDFSFGVAGLCALGGMTLGIVMGATQDFTLSPAHAHLNLLGWVTMALYGLYHRGAGRTGGVAGWLQVLCGALGAVAMAVGLGVYLSTGNEALVPLIMAGSVLAVAGMVLFLALVVVDARRRAPAPFPDEAQSG